jgi:small subunit ribosomal protein S20
LANHKSAAKRARQAIKKNARNTKAENAVKTFEKKVVKAIEAKSKELPTALREYVAKAMSAVSKGVYKKETISRKISRLSARAHAALNK